MAGIYILSQVSGAEPQEWMRGCILSSHFKHFSQTFVFISFAVLDTIPGRRRENYHFNNLNNYFVCCPGAVTNMTLWGCVDMSGISTPPEYFGRFRKYKYFLNMRILRIVSSLMHFTINWFLIDFFTFTLNSPFSLLLMSWKPIQTSTLPWKIVFFLQLKSFYDRIIPRYREIFLHLSDLFLRLSHSERQISSLIKNTLSTIWKYF